MVKLFKISAADIGLYYYNEGDETSERICASCGRPRTDTGFPERHLRLRKERADWGATYDGQMIITERVVTFLQAHASTPVTTIKVNRRPAMYALKLSEILRFDAKTVGTRFEDFCKRCGEYATIVGASPPAVFTDEKIDSMGIYRSDLIFACGREMHPIILVGEGLQKILMENFRELDFRVVRMSDPD